MPGRGAAGRIDQLEDQLDRRAKRSDEWLVRAVETHRLAKQMAESLDLVVNAIATGTSLSVDEIQELTGALIEWRDRAWALDTAESQVSPNAAPEAER